MSSSEASLKGSRWRSVGGEANRCFPTDFFFFCGGGALSAASLVPRGRCGGEDEGGAIQKREIKKGSLGQHSDGGCECVWVGLLHHTYPSRKLCLFSHPSCVPTPLGFRSLRLTQTWWKYLVQIKIRAPERLKAPAWILYFMSSHFSPFIFPFFCQIVNRQMEPFRWRESCVNIWLG